jgi:predicted nucleic acid-binding Zn ribbon protein
MEEIGKILPKVLRPQFSRLEPPVIEVLTPLWSQVAGKALAKACRPVAFSAGTLTLAIADPDWAAPLKQMADEIRAHVNNFLGRPVVRLLKIECTHEFTPSSRSPRQRESPATSEPGDWPRQRPRPTSGTAEPIGRSRVKYVTR